jgi:hypothetical protein
VSAGRAAPTTGTISENLISPFLSGKRTQTQEKGTAVTDRSEQARAPATQATRPQTPFRLDLEQQRKRAKELRQAFLAGHEAARGRFRLHHPTILKDDNTLARFLKLSDAQLVIARELGLPSWPKLKAHVLAMRRTLQGITRGAAAPDGDMTTLHVRCGSDIKSTLQEAGFLGHFLEYSDPLCQGPVVDDVGWLDRRADFLAFAYGRGTGRGREQIAEDLARAEQNLQCAAARYERVVLWFEHDSYDQIVLARCLAQFTDTLPARLEMITLNHYPGAVRFIGLGQLPPEALRLLWNGRKPVSEQQLLTGRTVWNLLRAPDPRPLAAMAAHGLPDLPYLAGAVRRHCQELPWISDGLSLTERLILQLLAEQPRTVGAIYRDLMLEREPLPWLGDLMMLFVIENMKAVSSPAFTGAFESQDWHWPKERLTITPLGLAILAGEVDWLSLNPPQRWLGGVSIAAGSPVWRWDDQTATTIRQ